MEELCRRSKLCLHIWQGQGGVPGKLRPAALEVSRERAPAGEGQLWVGGGHGRQDPYFPPVLPWVTPWLLTNPGLAVHFRLAGRNRGRFSFKSENSLQFPTPGILGLEKQTKRMVPPSGLTESTLSSSSESHGRRNEKGRTSKATCFFNQSLAARMF